MLRLVGSAAPQLKTRYSMRQICRTAKAAFVRWPGSDGSGPLPRPTTRYCRVPSGVERRSRSTGGGAGWNGKSPGISPERVDAKDGRHDSWYSHRKPSKCPWRSTAPWVWSLGGTMSVSSMEAGTLRLIHTADWQIGKVFRFAGNETMPLLQAARLDAITTIGRLARDEGARYRPPWTKPTLSRHGRVCPMARFGRFRPAPPPNHPILSGTQRG